MGIISAITRIGRKVVPTAAKPIIKNGVRFAKTMPELLLGCGADVFGEGMKKTKGSIFKKVEGGFLHLEKDIAKKTAKYNGGFFKRNFMELINTPKDLYIGAKNGAKRAKEAVALAKTSTKMAKKIPLLSKIPKMAGFLGATKGVVKAFGKKLPMIGVVLTVLFDGPEIFNAFKDGGFKEGMKEVGGVGLELGCMAAGAAIGSAICPGIGTAIGGIVGAIGGYFLRGKTWSERADEVLAQAQKEAQEEAYDESLEGDTPEYTTPKPAKAPVVTPAPKDSIPADTTPADSAKVPVVTPAPEDSTPENTTPADSAKAPVVTPAPEDSTPEDTTPANNVPSQPVIPEIPGKSQMTNEELIILLTMLLQQMQQQLMEHDEKIIELLNQQKTTTPTQEVEDIEKAQETEEVEEEKQADETDKAEETEDSEDTEIAQETELAINAREAQKAKEAQNNTENKVDNEEAVKTSNSAATEKEEKEITINIHIGKPSDENSSNPFSDENLDKEIKIKYAA